MSIREIIFFVISRIRFPMSISISPSLFAWFIPIALPNVMKKRNYG